MATKEFKNQKVELYKKQFENAKVAVVADYRGLSVEEITELRRALQASEADLTVTKNTLCKLAAQGTNFEAVSEFMQGPTAIAFGFGDEVAAAKILAKFIKENKRTYHLKIPVLTLPGHLILDKLLSPSLSLHIYKVGIMILILPTYRINVKVK